MTELESARWILLQRLVSLSRELRHWKALSRRTGPARFWTHHSQIRAFSSIVQEIARALHRSMRSPGFSAADAHAHARDVLALFRIWEFFRSKLAQRLEDRYVGVLRRADEVAWACYKPAAKAYKEPPLVFLNGGFSPFILPRHSRFQAEFVPSELIQDEALNDAMASLPFPVIGIPWYQVAAPWELPAVAHEVGHSVEADLGLTRTLDGLIGGAIGDEPRRKRWLAWRAEIFADFYGCRAVGPAFVSTLRGFLSGGVTVDETVYPPKALRLQLNDAFVGSPGAAADPDVARIVEAFAGLNLGLAPFSQDQQGRAWQLARDAANRRAIDGLSDVRVVTAAIRIAYDAIVAAPRPDLRLLAPLVDLLRQSAKPDIRAVQVEPEAAPQKQRAEDWLRRIRAARAE